MVDSLSLISAQITFLDPKLVLIHIPISQYTFFVQSILRLLFGKDQDDDAQDIPWTSRHDFLNISITPIECSIMCEKQLAERYIFPTIDHLNLLIGSNRQGKDTVQISTEEYIVIQVDGQGLDAGQRVLELTGPLAMAGISIFFITTYFSDYILVPARAHHIVTTALEQRGFFFSKQVDAFVSPLSPALHYSSSSFERARFTNHSPTPGLSHVSPVSAPTTPPAKDIPELQFRTFTKLRMKNIKPVGYSDLKLISCAGNAEYDRDRVEQLQNDLLQVLISTCPQVGTSSPPKTSESKLKQYSTSFAIGLGFTLSLPGGGSNPTTEEGERQPHQDVCEQPQRNRSGHDLSTSFLSITLTSTDPISILLEQRLLSHLGRSLLGNKEDEDVLVPIILDLTDLGWNATGIIGGVAGRLGLDSSGYQLEGVDGQDASAATTPIEVSFLSTARAGTVIVRACQLDRALKALEAGMALVNRD